MRVVIDTNVFVSSFLKGGSNPRRVIDLWREGKIMLCLSEAILEEYLEVLTRLGMSEEPELDELLELFKSRGHVVFVTEVLDLSVVEGDPDDDKFVECAVTAGARHVISGDRHLRELKQYQDVSILTPTAFLDSLGKRNEMA